MQKYLQGKQFTRTSRYSLMYYIVDKLVSLNFSNKGIILYNAIPCTLLWAYVANTHALAWYLRPCFSFSAIFIFDIIYIKFGI